MLPDSPITILVYRYLKPFEPWHELVRQTPPFRMSRLEKDHPQRLHADSCRIVWTFFQVGEPPSGEFLDGNVDANHHRRLEYPHHHGGSAPIDLAILVTSPSPLWKLRSNQLPHLPTDRNYQLLIVRHGVSFEQGTDIERHIVRGSLIAQASHQRCDPLLQVWPIVARRQMVVSEHHKSHDRHRSHVPLPVQRSPRAIIPLEICQCTQARQDA